MLNIVACLSLVALGHRPPTITVSSLLAEEASRDRLARLPEIPFKQLQASSYDRTQVDPTDPKTWFANKDYGQFIRTEQRDGHTEWVIMEHQGPGAITRIWTPLLKDKDKMVVRFYFDGSATPGIEENFNGLLRGNGSVKPPFGYIAWPDPGVTDGVGGDLYFPIPFAKGCKITLSEEPFYYSVEYRAYPSGVAVETYAPASVAALRKQIDAAARELLYPAPSGEPPGPATHLLNPGATVAFDAPSGPGAFVAMHVAVAPDISPQQLRSIVLRITFDGEQTVWCPIGDFFGCGIKLKPVWDRFRRVTGDGSLACCWTMPYQRSARVELVNLGGKAVPVGLRFATDSWKWDARSMYFHATWHHQFPLNTRPMSDWNYLTASGRGVYVGDTLTVMNPSSAWYGEGDERVYVDGEKFPSQLGTGTEDYYGYAWGMAEHFSSPFMAMPARDRKGRDNWLGVTTTSRVRGLDDIPFEAALKFDMEIWHWADCREEYSAATFWYGRPGATSNVRPAPEEAAEPLPEADGAIKGALECESMHVNAKSPDVDVSTQSGGVTDGTWSSGEQLFLQAHSVGDFVELADPNNLTGRHHLTLYATKSYDYGIVEVSVNGEPAKELDLYNPQPITSGPIELGEFDLAGKDLTLRLEVVGTNPASTGNHYYFGLDCVVVGG